MSLGDVTKEDVTVLIKRPGIKGEGQKTNGDTDTTDITGNWGEQAVSGDGGKKK